MGTRRGGGILARPSPQPEPRCGGEPTVERPESRAAERRRAEQMNIDPAETTAGERVLFHELEHLRILRSRRLGQSRKQVEDFRATAQVPQRELSENERMPEDFGVLE